MKKETPMLYSTPMVNAIQRETDPKTETRRTAGLDFINENPDSYFYMDDSKKENHWFRKNFWKKNEPGFEVKCPYGKVGDLLWVRETFGKSINVGEYVYKSDCDNPLYKEIKWKPSIHMPKDAARIWLEITEIKAERLNEITNEGALAEGIELQYVTDQMTDELFVYHQNYLTNKIEFISAINSYKTLWESINGKDSWNKNPWVWVIKFKKINK